MERHFHNDVVMVASVTLAAIIGINLARLGFGWINSHQSWPGPVLTLSRAGSALVTFN